MRDSTFMSSHPTGVPAGLAELTPVIVNHSPELASRRDFDSQQYEEDLHIRGQLFEQKHPSAMDHYGGVATVTYRGPREQEQFSQAHASAYLGQNQSNFASNAVPASFDLTRQAQNASYTTSQDSTTRDYSSMHQYGRVTSYQPQYGPPGTEIRVSLVTSVKIDLHRQVMAQFGRDDAQATCQGGQEHVAPYSYFVTVYAPAQNITQWSRPKSSIPLVLFLPYEGAQNTPQHVGTFIYTDTSAAASPSESELEHPRRPSETTSRYEPESPRHGHEMAVGQLPPIRATHAPSSGYYASSTYSTATSSDDYSTQASGSSYYAPSLVSSYGQTPGCTPPTSSWTGTAAATTSPLEMASNTMMSMPQSISVPPASRVQPRFVRAGQESQVGSGMRMGSREGWAPYGQYPHNKAQLVLKGSLYDMTKNWTAKETAASRRLVEFHRTQVDNEIHATFEPVDPDHRTGNAPVVSCIWWEERKDWYVTSVDTIGLLERLVLINENYNVDEKNRIRRNMEGFHPETITKTKAGLETFFKLIMNFPNPRPRHIEKDVKVFKWSNLDVALKKIIQKYRPSYSATTGRGQSEIEIAKPNSFRKHAVRTMPVSPYYTSSIPLSSTSSTFSEAYPQSQPSYSQPQTPSYASYPQHQTYAGGGGGASTTYDNSHMMLQQHRATNVGNYHYMDNTNATYMS